MATTILINSFPDLKVNIIGSGPELESLKKKTNELKLSAHIKFWGFVASHNQVLSIIKKSQLFCLPSVVEGFGLVTIEAMACGVPYVNSEIPPSVEVTNNGKGGLLFTPLNPVDLADKCTKILKDKNLYQQKVTEGLKLAKEYSWDKTVGELEKMYIKLTKIRSTKYEIRNKYKL
jgi:glycosyltransferase involved in cell wall biosynthesis